MPTNYIKGRGAQQNVPNKFEELKHITDAEFLEYCHKEGEEASDIKTRFQEVFPKTIVNKVNSPDVGMEYSLNPYQGCEHGCIYCYARNSHEYWGYSAGLDFEKQILVKKNSPELLAKKLWPGPITLILRKKMLFIYGIFGLFLFLVIRLLNFYGDYPWINTGEFTTTLMSFVSLTKYPPSFSDPILTSGIPTSYGLRSEIIL